MQRNFFYHSLKARHTFLFFFRFVKNGMNMNIHILSLGIVTCLTWKVTDSAFKQPKMCRSFAPAKCEMNRDAERLICTNGLAPRKNHTNAKTVYFCSWPENRLNPTAILNEFPQVEKLSIVNGNVTDIETDFPRSVTLKRLTLSNLSLQNIGASLFTNLENLEFLDLTANQLTGIPVEILKNRPTIAKLILTGNPWNCSGGGFEWILNKTIGSRIPNKNGLRCGTGEYSGKPVYTVVSFIRKMEKDCPRNICSCVMNNIVWNTQQSHLIPVITVNCSDRGLEELPAKLPVNTTTLLLARNNISDLLPLSRNEIYNGIADIYLDNNQVKSVDVLEGALWLKKFRVFSLRRNNLTQLPVYALDNAFEKNTNMAKIYLGQNPWKCDCSFTPDFQHFLIKYRSLVKDWSEVTCSQRENDENSNMEIIALSMNSLCRKPSHELNPLDILSVVFASLILIILGKLLFDWWSFRRTGKLPWIAAKMPW